ncbi:DUF4011 domain-containing protein [Dietzia aerolata]|uniref:DUF4011 domain-containing protein n=1 Tax=Dietzia aerolata TaxID=595984 RepID=A0ABV5JM37_9ACTN|nr:DUF4011 domain-containing protein [Dietzia aerolata]
MTVRHFPATNYALAHNSIPVIHEVEAINRSSSERTGRVAVVATLTSVDGRELAHSATIEIPAVEPRSGYYSPDRALVRPHLAEIVGRTESYPADLEFRLEGDPGVGIDTISADDLTEEADLTGREVDLAEVTVVRPPFRILAENEWFNAPAFFESLTAFVQPNTSEVRRILAGASRLLQERTGDSSLQGYQAGAKRAATIALAIYEALKAEGIRYINPPASFENTGQRIRSTSEVLSTRFGTCVDLAVTYSAVCEAAGLHPVVAMVEGHALTGIMLAEQTLTGPVLLEAGAIRNLVTSDVLLPLDAVFYDSVSFAEASKRGREILSSTSVRGLIDVAASRRDGMRPLPTDSTGETDIDADSMGSQKRSTSDDWVLPAVGGSGEDDEVDRAIRSDDSPARVRNWKQSLLDLTLRNRLLNIKPGADVLELILPSEGLAELDDLIHAGTSVELLGKDAVTDLRRLQGISDVTELPHEQLMDELTSRHRVHSEVTEGSYRNRLRGLARNARTLFEETGSANLYLTLGSMEITTSTGKPAQAPLFLIPVKITGGSGRSRFSITVDTSTQATPNYTLVEWLRAKHDAVIPALNEPPLDSSGLDIHRALAEISRSLASHSLPYEVRESAYVGICKFSTYGMWRDLDLHWASFNRSPVFRHLVEKSGTSFSDPAGDTDLRDIEVREDRLTLPIAADGAQMRAVVAAGQGRTFVLEGPPGTGKSQTITNLITHSLLEGKTILFVAEKQAALDVVKSRLQKVGLADFTLDLHGVEQKPASIRRQLKASIDLRVDYDDRSWRTVVDRYRARLAPLEEYPGKIHTANAAGYSLWSAVTTLDECGPGAALPVDPRLVGDGQIDELLLEDALRDFERLARSTTPGANPDWDLVGPGAATATDEELTAAVTRLRSALEALPEPVRDAIEAASAQQGTDGVHESGVSPTDVLTPLVAHLTELHEHGEVPARDLDSGPSRELADRYRRLAVAVQSFTQRITPVRALVPDRALISGDFGAAAQLAAAIDEKMFGKKKRRAAFDAALSDLVVDPSLVAPERVADLAADVARARQEMNDLTDQLNSLLVSSPHFGRGCLDEALPMDLHKEASTLDAIADSIEAQARFARDHAPLREMIARHGVGYSDIAAIREFDQAWVQARAVLDISPERLGRWAGNAPWLSRVRETAPRWADELAAGGGGVARRTAEMMRSLAPLVQVGLDKAVDVLLSGGIDPVETTVALRRGLAEASVSERSAVFGLIGFDPILRDGDVEEFDRAALRIREEAPNALAARLLDARPFRSDRLTGEVAELSRQLNAKRGGLSFRRLMERYGDAVTSATPCLFVSPTSLATFVPADGPLFDLVIFDEASQVTVDQAVGALGRARSAVIVGDSQQMPPSKFGSSSGGSDDDFDIDSDAEVVPADLDSILTECVESGLPRLWLSWHYRSQDERLIAFSNTQYYEGELSSLPSPGGEPDAGIELRRVAGHFYRSIPRQWPDGEAPGFRHGITPRLRTNPVEAEAIVDHIVERVNDPVLSAQSIAVVTFNIQQRDLILDALEASDDPLVSARLSDDEDPLVVKNLENVQGDERDVILFSTAFSAKSPGDRLPMNFGPLSRTGGEKRLNVAVTRARRKVVVFSSFDAADIDLARTSSKGLADLRGYLESAHVDAADERSAARVKNSIRDDLAERLRREGFEVSCEYGLSEFTVDLAVRHRDSERWECAVLLDSRRWADMPTVADREMTPGLLGGMMRWGSVERVWLPEWHAHPDEVVQKITTAVRSAAAVLAARDREFENARRIAEERLVADREREAARLAAEAAAEAEEPEEIESVEWAEADDIAVEQYIDEHREHEPVDTEAGAAQPPASQPGSTPESPVRSAAVAEPAPTPRPAPVRGPEHVRQVGFTRVADEVLGTKEDLVAPVSPEVRARIDTRLRKVVAAEAPMTPDELARRVGTCFDVRRVSSKMREVLLADLPAQWLHTTHGEEFVWPDGVQPENLDTFRTERALTDLPLEEIVNVMIDSDLARFDSDEERYRHVLDRFGMKRLTAGVQERLAQAWTLARSR